MRPHTRWLGTRAALGAAAATALLFALAEPPAGLWPLAFACLAPLLAALGGRGPLARARLGALAGALAALAVAIGPATVGAAGYFGRPLWQGFLLAGAIGLLFGASGFAAFAALAGDPRRGPLALAALRAGLAFAAGEWLRATLFGGLPWLLLAYALAPFPGALGLARWGGVALVSAWLAALAVAGVRLALGPRRRTAALALALLLAAGLASAPRPLAPGAPGSVAPASAGAPPPGAHRLALVQPALPMALWADPTHAAGTVAHLTELSERALRERGAVDVVVWPENAVQALLPANDALVARALARLGDGAGYLLLGAPRYDPAAPARRFNAALLFRGAPPAVATHDKVVLLPLFERAPPWLGALAAPGADLTAGAAPVVLPAGDGLRLGPLLCYEVLFPALARRLAEGGAGVLVNLSNDAWFAGSGGAEQHFAAAVVLAATLERPLLRATPTGVTGAIDATGRVAARLAGGQPGVLALDVVPAAGRSPAARLGDAPGWLALALAAAWTAAEAARRRAIARRA